MLRSRLGRRQRHPWVYQVAALCSYVGSPFDCGIGADRNPNRLGTFEHGRRDRVGVRRGLDKNGPSCSAILWVWDPSNATSATTGGRTPWARVASQVNDHGADAPLCTRMPHLRGWTTIR